MTHTSPGTYRVNLRVSFPVSCHSGELTRFLESARSSHWSNPSEYLALASLTGKIEIKMVAF